MEQESHGALGRQKYRATQNSQRLQYGTATAALPGSKRHLLMASGADASSGFIPAQWFVYRIEATLTQCDKDADESSGFIPLQRVCLPIHSSISSASAHYCRTKLTGFYP